MAPSFRTLARPVAPIAAVLAMAFAGMATAGERTSPLAQDTLVFEAGAFLSDFETKGRLQGPNGGTEIALEDELGLDDDQTSFRGTLAWRFAERHRLSVGYYSFDRSATGSADRSFIIDTEDQTLEFNAGVQVRTEFDWRLIPITYSYSFVLTDRFEAAASIGVHWADVDLGFEGEAHVNGEPVARLAAESQSASAPLPVLGLEASFAVTPRWIVGASGQYFGLDYKDYSGNLTDIRLTTEYRFADTVGLGIGYTWYDIDFSEDNGRYEYDVKYNYDGFEAYLNFRF